MSHPHTKTEAPRRLHIWEKATLLQYILNKGLPPWANGNLIRVLARLCNLSERDAAEAFERAVKCGYLDEGGAA